MTKEEIELFFKLQSRLHTKILDILIDEYDSQDEWYISKLSYNGREITVVYGEWVSGYGSSANFLISELSTP